MALKLDVKKYIYIYMITKEQIIFGNKFRDLDNGYNIFYRDIHEVNDFFINCNKEIPFILISHNSDENIDERYESLLF
jgi:hypothetical protein